MKITSDEVLYVARLARLDLAEDEAEALAGQLDTILEYVGQLGEIETEGIVPTTHALALTNAFREDEVQDSMPQDVAIGNAPLDNGHAFVVPKII